MTARIVTDSHSTAMQYEVVFADQRRYFTTLPVVDLQLDGGEIRSGYLVIYQGKAQLLPSKRQQPKGITFAAFSDAFDLEPDEIGYEVATQMALALGFVTGLDDPRCECCDDFRDLCRCDFRDIDFMDRQTGYRESLYCQTHRRGV